MRPTRPNTRPRGGAPAQRQDLRTASTGDPFSAPLPQRVRELLAGHGATAHPGLALDKYAMTWAPAASRDGDGQKRSEAVQRPTVQSVAELSRNAPDGLDFDGLHKRREDTLEALHARCFVAETAGPLTLHLARAAALENGGLCLHPVYGFAYLPGSGLKGMARAYAETVWLEAQPAAERAAAWRQIEEVFGWAPTPERRRQIDDPKHPAQRRYSDGHEVEASAGAVVFHDAWPEAWPKLEVDIVNNHHGEYYSADEKSKPVPPPGDWENPVPVYFLAVAPKTPFRFALAPRRPGADEQQLLDRAREWLLGALVHEGAGAKTAAGYGRFRPVNAERPVLDSPARLEFKAELELVTPAFLAGAGQGQDDCDLRPATLRGLLRWWWRTLHAGYLAPAELRQLETAVWGSAEVGGAVRVEMEPMKRNGPVLYDLKDGFRPKDVFAREHHLARSPNSKTTQGLFYLSYGMDEEVRDGAEKVRRQRWFLGPGSRWRVRLTARATTFPGNAADLPTDRTAALALGQAQAALWLLCHLGGVGSKARNGFGSLRHPEELGQWDLERCRKEAADLRSRLGLPGTFKPAWVASAALADATAGWVRYTEVELPTTDEWQALDALGYSYQALAQRYKHDRRKATLGLPRKIHGPNDQPLKNRRTNEYLQDPKTHRPPLWLSSPRLEGGGKAPKERFAAPVHFHFALGRGGLVVRFTGFPMPDLPDLATSQAVLDEVGEHLRSDLPSRITQRTGRRDDRRREHLHQPDSPVPRSPSVGVKQGDRVEVILLEERTKSGGWKAKHEPTGMKGHIVNSADVPASKQPGDQLDVVIHSVPADGRELIFRVSPGKSAR